MNGTPSDRSTRRKIWILVALSLTGVFADQLTKYLAVSRLTTALDGREGFVDRLHGFMVELKLEQRAVHTVRVLDDYWHHRYVENPGAAWGLFANLPDGVRGPFFGIITIASVAFILWMYRRVPAGQTFLLTALALVLSGALGNFIDRLLRGYVIDFIDWHWRNQPGLRWPTFNIADALISVGVVMMLLDAVLLSLGRRSAPEEAPAQPATEAVTDSPEQPL